MKLSVTVDRYSFNSLLGLHCENWASNRCHDKPRITSCHAMGIIGKPTQKQDQCASVMYQLLGGRD